MVASRRPGIHCRVLGFQDGARAAGKMRQGVPTLEIGTIMRSGDETYFRDFGTPALARVRT
jgi:hypothetical protein